MRPKRPPGRGPPGIDSPRCSHPPSVFTRTGRDGPATKPRHCRFARRIHVTALRVSATPTRTCPRPSRSDLSRVPSVRRQSPRTFKSGSVTSSAARLRARFRSAHTRADLRQTESLPLWDGCAPPSPRGRVSARGTPRGPAKHARPTSVRSAEIDGAAHDRGPRLPSACPSARRRSPTVRAPDCAARPGHRNTPPHLASAPGSAPAHPVTRPNRPRCSCRDRFALLRRNLPFAVLRPPGQTHDRSFLDFRCGVARTSHPWF